MVLAWGSGTQLAKMDIKQAYRVVPVHPHDRKLVGMRWDGKVFIDKTLPFSLRSAPLILSALMQWIMEHDLCGALHRRFHLRLADQAPRNAGTT